MHVVLRSGIRAPRPRGYITSAACGVCSADVVDLRPLVRFSYNVVFRLDAEEAWRQSPLAYASAMADELDALYMPGLIWSYPGTTMIASATVNISPSQGISFLRGLAQSLLSPVCSTNPCARLVPDAAGCTPCGNTGSIMSVCGYFAARRCGQT